MLPKVLKNFNFYIEGVGYTGRAEEITLPKLSRKMEEYQGGGMSGPVDIDLGMEKIEMDFTLAEFNKAVIGQFGLVNHAGNNLHFLGALVGDDGTSTTDSIEVVVRGRQKEQDWGTAKRGDKNQFKVSLSIAYYKVIYNGETIIEIDLVNMIENINGEDRLSAQRSAIGL